MGAIIDGFNWIIDLFTTIFDFIFNIFDTIGMVFAYLSTIIQMCTSVLMTFPNWLRAFGFITISICAIYMVVGRDAGKTDKGGKE